MSAPGSESGGHAQEKDRWPRWRRRARWVGAALCLLLFVLLAVSWLLSIGRYYDIGWYGETRAGGLSAANGQFRLQSVTIVDGSTFDPGFSARSLAVNPRARPGFFVGYNADWGAIRWGFGAWAGTDDGIYRMTLIVPHWAVMLVVLLALVALLPVRLIRTRTRGFEPITEMGAGEDKIHH